MQHIELAELNAIISEELLDFLERFENNAPKRKEVFEFQRALIVFCFLQTGGQRREVIVGFQTDVSNNSLLNIFDTYSKLLEFCNVWR